MTTRSRAVVLAEFDEPLEVRDFEVPDPDEMAAVVQVEYGRICGTDVHLSHGRLPIPSRSCWGTRRWAGSGSSVPV
jgi:D-arabinose 1-dehydrogenase-like Zn-dependent alcohol dehydrogenase